MSTSDLSQQHVLPDQAHALPTNTLAEETQRLASAGQTGIGGPAAGTAGAPSGTSTADDLRESARRQVEARLGQSHAEPSGVRSSNNPTTDLQQQHVIPDRSTALPTNALVDETARLSSAGTTGLGGSSVQTVGNTSASFTPHTASDANTSAHAVAPVDAGPKVALEGQKPSTTASSAVPREQAGLISDYVPVPVKDAAAQASQAFAGQVEAARQGLDHAFNKNDAITPGNELPGGWGPTPPASTTGPNATTTIYQDISSALNTVGQAAYNAVPASLIGKLHSGPAAGSSPVRTTTNTVPHQQASAPGAAHATSTTEDISNAVKEGAAGLQENAKLAADKVAELGKTAYNSLPTIHSPFPAGNTSATNTAANRDVGPINTPAKGAVAGLPDPASIIPHSKDATSGSSLATTELPTLQDIKAEAVHIVDELKHLVGLGGATAATGSTSHSHEVAAVDKGPKVDLLSSSHEIAPASGNSSLMGVDTVQSSASATRGEVTPAQVKTTPLAGGGGLAATIADDVADAARHSTATSVGEAAPGAREDPRAGAGGLAATIADDVAEAARHSPATSVGDSTGGAAKGGLAATIAPEVARAAQHSSATHPNEGLGGPSLTGEQSALAGGGGLAATIADDVARAAKESPATSVGATGPNAIPVAAEGHHGHSDQQHSQTRGSAVENLHLGRPVKVVGGTLAGLAGAAGLATAGAHHGSSGPNISKALPEARETSHSPAVLQHGSVPTSSTGPTSVLSSSKGAGSTAGSNAFGAATGLGAGAVGAGGAAAAAKSPSSALEAAKTSHRDDTPSPSVPKAVESDGPHGLVKVADGSYKHRHELTEAELAEHDRQQQSAGGKTVGSAATSGTAAHPKGVDAGSSVPPHRDIDTAAANRGAAGTGHSATPLSPAKSTASDSSSTPSGHKKKQSLSEKLKHALKLDK